MTELTIVMTVIMGMAALWTFKPLGHAVRLWLCVIIRVGFIGSVYAMFMVWFTWLHG